LKAERRQCKTWKEVTSILAVFAGPSDEENDNEDGAQVRDDAGEACYNPSVFEWQPNPVIFSHLRDENFLSQNPSPSAAGDMSDWRHMDNSEAAQRFRPDRAAEFEDDDTVKNDEVPPDAPRYTGPATTCVNLSSFPCPQCSYVARKKFELKYATTLLMCAHAKTILVSMLLKCTTTDSNVPIMAAKRHLVFVQTSHATKRHTVKEKDLSARIRGAKHPKRPLRVKIISTGI
jgi:hypothetical protein